eukprot:COSAG03_NODE_21967_length_297_cov_0.540404_1_plen_37_part_10
MIVIGKLLTRSFKTAGQPVSVLYEEMGEKCKRGTLVS